MNLRRLSLAFITAAIIGILGITVFSLYALDTLEKKREQLTHTLALSERINHLSVGSDNLVLFGANEELWTAFRTEAEAIQRQLRALDGDEHSEVEQTADRIDNLINAVTGSSASGLSSIDSDRPASAIEPAETSPRSRIVMNQVAMKGMELDDELTRLIQLRRIQIQSHTATLTTLLAIVCLIFGFSCVGLFALLHARMGRPIGQIQDTLRRIAAGDTSARARLSGNNELTQLADTLNHALDEREAAHAEAEIREESLRSALAELEDTRDSLIRSQQVGQIGTWERTLADDHLQLSEQALDIFGIDRSEFTGDIDSFFAVIHPEHREWFSEERDDWLESGGELDVTLQINRRDGEQRWVRILGKVIFGEDGHPRSTNGIVQDITEEHALRERQEQLRQLIEGSEDWCGVVEDNYRIVWANHAYTEHHDLSLDALKGMRLPELVGEDYFEQELRPHADRCLAGEPQRFETKRQLPSQSERHLLARYYPIDRPDQASYLMGFVVTDVTSLRKTREELSKQTRMLEIAGQAVQYGGWSVDLASETVEWSDVVGEIHAMPRGFSPSVERAIKFYVPEHRERITKVFRDCANHGIPYDEEFEIIDANGDRKWVRTVGEPVYDEQGNIFRVQGAFQDISKQKETEERTQHLGERLAILLESMTDGFFGLDHQWRFTHLNPKASSLLGATPDELLGEKLWVHLPHLSGGEVEKILSETMHKRTPQSTELFIEDWNGWFQINTYPWDGGVAVFCRDMTETYQLIKKLRTQERALRTSSEELKSALKSRQGLVNALPAHVAVVDSDSTVVDVNAQWRQFARENAYRGSDYGIGTNYIELCEAATGRHADEAQDVANGLKDVLAGDRKRFALEYPCHSPEEKRWFRVAVNSLDTPESQASSAVVMHVDITERKLAELRMQELAESDPTTGQFSRIAFTRKLEDRLASSGWIPDSAILDVDIVKLHDVNGAFGHEAGDRVLKKFGARLQSIAGKSGLVGRAGGDQFFVFLPLSEGEQEDQVINKILSVADDPFVIDEGGTSLTLDLRIGFSLLQEQPRSAKTLIKEAEQALFECKNIDDVRYKSVRYSKELEADSEERITLAGELRDALENDELELHYQPKVNLLDGDLISAEALIRWRNPEKGLLQPGQFIPVAEQSQLIGPIGDWAIDAACKQLRQWQDAGLDIVRIAVNVSQIQFKLGNFTARVRQVLEDYKVDPRHLTLEITESVFEKNSEFLLDDLNELHELGVRLSLDDFGTGYSSLLYLQRYPFDEIKVDRGFIKDISENPHSRDIVSAIMALARAVGLEVIAEGIETPEQVKALTEIGCHFGQGFYFSVPLETEDFRWLLEQASRLPLAASGERL